jgi:Ca2+-transporting ATPase
MHGLTSDQARARLAEAGPNALPAATPPALWRRFLRQFASPLIYVLLFALVFDLGVWVLEGADDWPIEATAIGVILLLNAGLGLVQERRSEAALARLRDLSAAQAWVWRDDALAHIPADEIVPGDWVRLEAGDRVPADGVLRRARGVMLDEAVLTGESVPVDRGSGEEALSGTLAVRGTAVLEVTRTGAGSAMGRLATLLSGIEAAPTPLERRVDALGRQIARAVLALAAALGVAGIAAEGWAHAPEVVIFAVALAVAAVPEGLPAVLTVALTLGVERMATRRAVVRRLSAVESLGSVTVICTDKTGTLTENRMDVRSLDAPDRARALMALVLVNDADLATGAGDPLDSGLLRYAVAQGLDPAAVRAAHPVVDARTFDSAWKFARATVDTPDGPASYLKGAPEVVLARCALTPDQRAHWTMRADTGAAEGARVIALAMGAGTREDGLTMLGLVHLWDPPRDEVPPAVAAAQAAGIRVVLITGDHPATAGAVASMVGLPATTVTTGDDLDHAVDGAELARLRTSQVFARVRPEQKLALVEALQRSGEIVAMTGDGVNDAPALKKSDIGVAMGMRGSDVSREVADLVLLDDNFATIVGAVEEGRSIYENVQSFLRFLFSTNLSEVLLVAGGSAAAFALGMREADGGPLLPLTAAQILWINLVTDGLPALALALDRTPGVMRQPPRPPAAPLLDRPSLQFVAGAGALKALLALGLLALVPQLGYDTAAARATAFHFMAIGQLLYTYPARRSATQPLPNTVLHGAVAAGVAIQVLAAWVPVTSTLLGGAWLPWPLWLLVAGMALVSWAGAENLARIVWRAAR